MSGPIRARVVSLMATPLEGLEEHLILEPDPAPAEVAAHEVLVGVRAANVGWVDALMTSGQYQHVPEVPYTPGLEFSGQVLGVGSAVTRFRPGDRVIADGLLTGPRSSGSHRRYGGFAAHALAPEEGLIPLPHGYSFEEGACFLAGAETAEHALIERAQLKSGEIALILGATGSTGLAAVQRAKAQGARVLAVGRSREKLEIARKLGADAAIVLGPGAPNLKDAVRAESGGRGADVVYDAVGGPLSVEALRAAAFGARFVLVGWAGTPTAARGDRDPNTLPTNLILMKGIDVLGSPAAIAAQRDPVLRQRRLAAVLARADALRPHIGHTYALREVHAALRAKLAGKHVGNVAIQVVTAP
ncbi:MAG: NADPH:quinone oxidoreductase family protein [Myxococcota bacterium]